MKCLITGANGMLGSALCTILINAGAEVYPTDINTQGTTHIMQFLDIRDKGQIKALADKIKPDFLFHLAAETNVDKCELEPEHAHKTNVLGTENVALVCKDLRITMVYISTCGVFPGTKKGLYTEDDEPGPVSVYGKSKLQGETIVKNLLQKYYIFRAGWMMGGSGKDKKFVAKIVELMDSKDQIPVVNDKFGSPTYTVDLSRGMLEVIKKGRYGLYHMVNSGSCSRYDIARKIKEYLKKDKVLIKPISSSQFPLPAPRPDSEAAENKNLKLIGLGDIMRPWEEALRDYLKQLCKQK
jgi:dTDP-4-dehydrorhamnose reductase